MVSSEKPLEKQVDVHSSTACHPHNHRQYFHNPYIVDILEEELSDLLRLARVQLEKT